MPDEQAVRATKRARSVKRYLRSSWPFALPLAGLALFLAGCGGGGTTSFANPSQTPSGSHVPSHVVVLIQENRTVDNLFHVLPGVDTVDYGLNSQNQRVLLM